MTALSPSSIAAILSGRTDFHPVVQILEAKRIPNIQQERYKLVISDGSHFCQAMLATQLHNLIVSQKMGVNSVIRLEEFVCNEIQGRKIVIVLHLEVLVQDAGHKIGNPQMFESGGAARPAQTAAPPMQPQQRTYAQPQTTSQTYGQPNNPTPSYGQSNTRPAYGQTTGASSYGQTNANVGQREPYRAPQQSTGSSAYGGYQQSNPYMQNRAAPVVRDDGDAPRVATIKMLNPYQNRWTIKARLTAKSEIRRWSNARGEGKLFSIDLLDNSGEVRATFFKEAVDKFYDLLEPGKMYYLSGGRVKVANTKYTSIKNEYEITFDTNSEIRPAPEDENVAKMNYSFRKIEEMQNLDANATVDVVAVVRSVGDLGELTSKQGKDLTKRDITVFDDSGSEIRLTLWNEKARINEADWADNPIIAVKGAKVNDYNGKTLSSISSTMIQINPSIPEAIALKRWFDTAGVTTSTKSLSLSGGGGGGNDSFATRKTISSIKEERLGFGEKPDYITVKATVSFIKHDTQNWFYTACEHCHKKVTQDLNGHFVCDRCNKTMERSEYRYILSLTANDHTGSTWMTAFNDQAVTLLAKSANELAELQLANEAAYESVFQQACFKTYVMRLRVKSELVQDESRLKVGVASLQPLNFVKETKEMLDVIEQY